MGILRGPLGVRPSGLTGVGRLDRPGFGLSLSIVHTCCIHIVYYGEYIYICREELIARSGTNIRNIECIGVYNPGSP